MISIFSQNVPAKDRRYVFKKSNKNKQTVYRESDYTLLIRGNKFRQGDLLLVKLIQNKGLSYDLSKIKLFWNGKKLKTSGIDKNHYITFLPLPPEIEPGIYEIGLHYLKNKNFYYKYYAIQVKKAPFQVRRTRRINPLKLSPRFSPEQKLSEETVAFIQKCEQIKKEVYLSDSPLMVNENFGMPLNKNIINSPFYIKRYYSANSAGKPHSGVDLKGRVGDPIFAIQNGKVVLSSSMYFEGLFTVIDHGHKIFSLYMHQSKTYVKAGDFVKKGDLIGRIGKSGRVTGPHLHWGMKVNDVLIDPLSVVNLMIFD
ncbi:MAG: M23 family metallopeptidase [Leptospiraceae bacterium]|nr:M23 family metallopeptidase [Leptospiraceae bacterium]